MSNFDGSIFFVQLTTSVFECHAIGKELTSVRLPLHVGPRIRIGDVDLSTSIIYEAQFWNPLGLFLNTPLESIVLLFPGILTSGH